MTGGKRKRKRGSSSSLKQTPAKKAKTSNPSTPKTPKSEKKSPRKKRLFPLRHESEKQKKKYNKRRRLNYIRMELARALEKALVEAPGIPLIYHLFTDRDSMGTPRAPLQLILRQLRISTYVKNTHFLGPNYLKSLSQFSSMFVVENDEPDGPLYLKFRPIFDKKDATVYIDNLPDGCNEEKLLRLAKCYGHVADVRIARKGHRWVRPRYIAPKKKNHQKGEKGRKQAKSKHIHRIPPKRKPLIDVGRRYRQWGFVRFCDPDSAKKMVEAFEFNDPTLPFERFQQRERVEQEEIDRDLAEMHENGPDLGNPVAQRQLFYFHHPFRSFATVKLIREIEELKKRRRHRPWPMFRRLFKLRLRLRGLRARERSCREKAGLTRRLTRRKGKRRRMAERQQRLERQQEEEQARLDAIAEEQERLDNIEMGILPPPAEPAGPVRPIRPTAPAKNLRLLMEVEEEKKKAKKKIVNMNRKLKRRMRRRKKANEKKRKRKKMCKTDPRYIQGGVRRYFRDIEVLSLKKYLKLKDDWRAIQRTVLRTMQEEREAEPGPAPDQLPDLDVDDL